MSKKKQQMEEVLANEFEESGDILDEIEQSEQRKEKEKENEQEKPSKVRVTVYLSLEHVDGLDQTIAKRRRRTGKSPRRSHLIAEAIEMFLAENS